MLLFAAVLQQHLRRTSGSIAFLSSDHQGIQLQLKGWQYPLSTAMYLGRSEAQCRPTLCRAPYTGDGYLVPKLFGQGDGGSGI